MIIVNSTVVGSEADSYADSFFSKTATAATQEINGDFLLIAAAGSTTYHFEHRSATGGWTMVTYSHHSSYRVTFTSSVDGEVQVFTFASMDETLSRYDYTTELVSSDANGYRSTTGSTIAASEFAGAYKGTYGTSYTAGSATQITASDSSSASEAPVVVYNPVKVLSSREVWWGITTHSTGVVTYPATRTTAVSFLTGTSALTVTTSSTSTIPATQTVATATTSSYWTTSEETKLMPARETQVALALLDDGVSDYWVADGPGNGEVSDIAHKISADAVIYPNPVSWEVHNVVPYAATKEVEQYSIPTSMTWTEAVYSKNSDGFEEPLQTSSATYFATARQGGFHNLSVGTAGSTEWDIVTTERSTSWEENRARWPVEITTADTTWSRSVHSRRALTTFANNRRATENGGVLPETLRSTSVTEVIQFSVPTALTTQHPGAVPTQPGEQVGGALYFPVWTALKCHSYKGGIGGFGVVAAQGFAPFGTAGEVGTVYRGLSVGVPSQLSGRWFSFGRATAKVTPGGSENGVTGFLTGTDTFCLPYTLNVTSSTVSATAQWVTASGATTFGVSGTVASLAVTLPETTSTTVEIAGVSSVQTSAISGVLSISLVQPQLTNVLTGCASADAAATVFGGYAAVNGKSETIELQECLVVVYEADGSFRTLVEGSESWLADQPLALSAIIAASASSAAGFSINEGFQTPRWYQNAYPVGL